LPSRDSGEANVTIGFSHLEDPGTLDLGWHWPSPEEGCLTCPGLGLVWIRHGSKIEFQLLPETDAAGAYRVMGPIALSAVFTQRGGLVLHGSTVSIEGTAIGLLGSSGAGKSTLVTALVRRGAKFVSDDQVFLTEEAGKYFVHPASRVIKLWEDSRLQIGADLQDEGRLFPDHSKDALSPPEQTWCTSPCPLAGLFILKEASQIALEKIPASAAVVDLLRHTHGVRVFHKRPVPQHFQQVAKVAAAIPVKNLLRPKDFSQLTAVVEAIWAEVRPPAPGESKAL
jgi:hypothetical protein